MFGIYKKSLLTVAFLFAFVGTSVADMTFDEWLKSNQGKEQPAPKEEKKTPPKPKPTAPKKGVVKKAPPPKTAAKPTPAPAAKAAPAKQVEPKAETPPPPPAKAEAPPAEKPVVVPPPQEKTETATPPPTAAPKEVPVKKEEVKEQKPADKEADVKTPGFAGKVGTAQKEAEIHGHEEGLVAPFGITGGWGGLRTKLLDHGITIKGLYSGEYVSNFSGGALNKTDSLYHDNLDLTMSIDTEKAGWWTGGTLWVYALRNTGNDPSAYTIGDLQTASNIGVLADQFIINEAWWNQDFAGGRVSALAGLYNLNSEFFVTAYGSLFINSSFGIEPEVSHNVNVSIFPMSGLGARLRVKPTENSYIQAADFDGNPTMRQLPAGVHGVGEFQVVEAGIINEPSDYKVGYWKHTASRVYNGKNFDDGDYGYYGIIDQKLLEFNNAEHSSVGVFVQYGSVPSDRNDYTGYLGYGLHVHGLFPGRTVDSFGIAYAKADTQADAETVIEFTYRLVLTDWLTLRPDYQIIQNPGGSSANPTANAGFLRFEIQL